MVYVSARYPESVQANSFVAKPIGINPTIVAYQGRFEAGGTVKTSHHNPNARLGAANAKPINLSSGCRGESVSNLFLRMP